MFRDTQKTKKWSYFMRSFIFNFSAQKIEKLGIKGTPVIILSYLDQFFKSGKADVKVLKDKNYYWITSSHIVEDLPFLNIKKQMVSQYIDLLCEKGVLEKYPKDGEEYCKTKKYLHINYNLLVEQVDGDFKQIVGNDKTLQYYMPQGSNYYNSIRYNSCNFIYECPAIQSVIVESDKNKYCKLLLGYLQTLLSPTIFESIIKNLRVTTTANTIKLSFKLTNVIVDNCVYLVEQAVVSAYTSLLISQLINKNKQPKSTPKNTPLLNQISL